MTPEKLIEVLKRYQRESNQSELILASRIGVNHHTVKSLVQRRAKPDKRNVGVSRILSQARRIPLSVLPLVGCSYEP
jgi:hypothetical protein